MILPCFFCAGQLTHEVFHAGSVPSTDSTEVLRLGCGRRLTAGKVRILEPAYVDWLP